MHCTECADRALANLAFDVSYWAMRLPPWSKT
jgi:hypothetical protein